MTPTARPLLVVLLCAALTGCAAVPPGAGSDPVDPWEKLNRQTHAMNTFLDDNFLVPVARGYTKVVPQFARARVTCFFNNLGEPANMLNNALQGKGAGFFVSLYRFLTNSTFGLLGLFDFAGPVGGLAERREDFGQTLRVWGVPQGPYFVIPFLGPSTVTDAGGKIIDWLSEPMTYVHDPWISWGSWAVFGVDYRANLLAATDLLEDSVDAYVMARQAYLGARRSAVWDGSPPLELTPDEFEDEDEDEDNAERDAPAPEGRP